MPDADTTLRDLRVMVNRLFVDRESSEREQVVAKLFRQLDLHMIRGGPIPTSWHPAGAKKE